MNRIVPAFVLAGSLLVPFVAPANEPQPVAPPAASVQTSTSPSPLAANAAPATPAVKSGGFAWAIEGGAGIGSVSDGDVTVYVGPFGHLGLFLGGNVTRGPGGGLAIGYMAVIDSDSSGILQRHVFAAQLAGGILYAGLGLGPGAMVPFDGNAIVAAVSFTGDIGVRFGDSGFFLSAPFGVDFVIGGLPIKTMSLTLGFASL